MQVHLLGLNFVSIFFTMGFTQYPFVQQMLMFGVGVGLQTCIRCLEIWIMTC